MLVGDSQLGKTIWARSLGRHNYWNGMTCLSDWDDDADYLVADDFEWDYFPQKKAIFGCQREIILTDKYVKKKRIQWGKPCIYICNPDSDPRLVMKRPFAVWFDMNVVIFNVINHFIA